MATFRAGSCESGWVVSYGGPGGVGEKWGGPSLQTTSPWGGGLEDSLGLLVLQDRRRLASLPPFLPFEEGS